MSRPSMLFATAAPPTRSESQAKRATIAAEAPTRRDESGSSSPTAHASYPTNNPQNPAGPRTRAAATDAYPPRTGSGQVGEPDLDLAVGGFGGVGAVDEVL